MQDFDGAYRRYGSTPEVAVWALMSAFAGCGHCTARAESSVRVSRGSHACTAERATGLQQPHHLDRRPLAAPSRGNAALLEARCNGPQ